MTGVRGSSPDALGTLTITVDGREIPADKGEMVIAAAERGGIFIPRFCYHPRMKPVGMCRMCLVEIAGPRGPSLQPACFVEVADGQEVHSASPAARKAQEGVLEFLLLNHPLDCPVCDKGGECPLQDQSVSHGPGETRFLEEKRHWPKPIELGPLTLLDRERCIQCGRCTRFADEVAGEPMIDFAERGDRIEVAVFPDQPFDSYFSGNTVQICPVGALTSVPYRFKSRPWDLEQVETTCTTCAVGCRMVAQSSAGRLVRYLGIDAEPVNQSWLCDRGRYGFEAVNSPDRLVHPLVRRDGEMVETSWRDALGEVAAAVRAALDSKGPTSVGLVGGARLANEDVYAWVKLAKSVIGTDNVDAQLGDGLPGELVATLPRATIDEALSARVLLVLTGDLREELPVLYLRLRERAASGALTIIECAPSPTALSTVAAVTVVYRPGEAPALARALTASRTEDGQSGLEAAQKTAGLSPDALRTAREILTGQTPGDPRSAAASEPAAASPAAAEASPAAAEVPGTEVPGTGLPGTGVVVVLGRPSLAESESSVAAAAAELASAWPGARFLPALRRANVIGAIDLGCVPGMLPGRVSLELGREAFEGLWGSVASERGMSTAQMLTAAAAGEVEVLVLVGADPLADFPDRDLARRALDEVRYLVSVDTVPSSSTMLADVVLPAAGYGERDGTTTNIESRVSRLAAKVVPPGVARADWAIATELAELLGADLGFESVTGIWDEIERVSPLHRHCTRAALSRPTSADGLVVPLPVSSLGAPAGRRPRPLDPVATPGIESVEEQGAPLVVGAAIGLGSEPDLDAERDEERDGEADPVPDRAGEEGDPPRATPGSQRDRLRASGFDATRWLEGAGPVALDRYSWRLVARRALYDCGTLVTGAPSLAPLRAPDHMRLRPRELEQLGVESGGTVRVRSERGELEVTVVADESVPSAVAVMTFNAASPDSPGVATLIDSSLGVVELRIETVTP